MPAALFPSVLATRALGPAGTFSYTTQYFPSYRPRLLFLGQSVALDPNRPPHYARQTTPNTESTSASSSQATGAGATTSVPSTAATTPNPGPSFPCASGLEKIASATPTEPPEYSSFSASYYESHPRTADDPLFECGWIGELPGDLDDVTREDQNKTAEWFMGLDPEKDGEEYLDAMEFLS